MAVDRTISASQPIVYGPLQSHSLDLNLIKHSWDSLDKEGGSMEPTLQPTAPKESAGARHHITPLSSCGVMLQGEPTVHMSPCGTTSL